MDNWEQVEICSKIIFEIWPIVDIFMELHIWDNFAHQVYLTKLMPLIYTCAQNEVPSVPTCLVPCFRSAPERKHNMYHHIAPLEISCAQTLAEK